MPFSKNKQISSKIYCRDSAKLLMANNITEIICGCCILTKWKWSKACMNMCILLIVQQSHYTRNSFLHGSMILQVSLFTNKAHSLSNIYILQLLET